MKLLLKINLIVVTLLSLAASIPKLLRIPEEVGFFADAGLGELSVVAFGLLQLIGGGLLIFRKTRLFGASIATVTFLLSAVMLFLTGNTIFGLVSIIPVLMADIVIFNSVRKRRAVGGPADSD